MTIHKYALGLALAAACGIFGPTGLASAATTWQVNGASASADDGTCAPCKTIQGGVDKSASGDTVDVAAGTYTETVTVSKAITLKGAQAGVDARGRTGATETVVNGAGGSFSVTGSGTAIDGFTITSADGSNLGAGVAFSSSGAGRRFVNNIVSDNAFGMSLGNAAGATTLIRHNAFRTNQTNDGVDQAAEGNGIYGDAGIHDVLVDENAFSGNVNAAVLLTTTPPAVNSDIEVTDNQATDPFIVIDTDDSSISGNDVTNEDGSAIYLESVHRVDVDSNDIHDADSAGIRLGSTLGGAGSSGNVSIVGNQIRSNNASSVPDRGGIAVTDTSYTGTLAVHHNRIVGNKLAGVTNTAPAATVDAQDNWWGCNTGPNSVGCDGTSGDVDGNPWLQLRLSALPNVIQTGAASTLLADISIDSDGNDFSAPPFPSTPIVFSASAGTVNPTSPSLTDGGASSTYTAPATEGPVTGTVTLDGQPATTTITVKNPVNGTSGNNGNNGNNGQNGAPGTSGTFTFAGTNTKPVAVAAGALKASKKRKVAVKVSCPVSNGLCDGTVKLVRKKKTIARQGFTIRGGRTAKVVLTVSKAQYKAAKKSNKVSISIFSRDLQGAASTLTKATTLTK